jgi:hypothetical protein
VFKACYYKQDGAAINPACKGNCDSIYYIVGTSPAGQYCSIVGLLKCKTPYDCNVPMTAKDCIGGYTNCWLIGSR